MRLLVLPMIAFAACAADQPPPAAGTAAPPGAERAPGPRRGGRVFISPMGEPFRPDESGEDGMARWFAGADADHDGALTVAEMQADAARFYAALDVNRDGEIDPAEIERYETEVAPEIHLLGMGRLGGGFRGRGHGGHGPAGAMRAGGGRGGFDRGRRFGLGARPVSLLDLPEPVAAADANFNRGVSLAEFRQAAGQRFLLLDANHDGKIARDELTPFRPMQRALPATQQPGPDPD